MDKLIFGAFALLLTLKLTHEIDWSWWCITAPLWGLLFDDSYIRIIKIKNDE